MHRQRNSKTCIRYIIQTINQLPSSFCITKAEIAIDTKSAFTFSKLKIETLEEVVKYVQS